MKKKLKNKKKSNKGFTLVELLATIAILAIIASVGLYVSVEVVKNAKEKSYQVTINNVEKNTGTYVTENSNKIFYLTRGNIEYQCISIGELIEMGYLDTSVINAEVDSEGDKISLDDFIYIERDSKTKSLLKSYYDKKNHYNCSDAVKAEGDITFLVRPSMNEWSHTKEVTINYKIKNRQNTDSCQYVYSLGNNTTNISATNNPMTLTISENTTIIAKILRNNEPLKQLSLSIGKTDNDGPTISLTANHTLSGNHNDQIRIPVTVSDSQSGVNKSTIDKTDFTVTIGGEGVLPTSLTKLSEVEDKVNYELIITNSTYRGELSVKVAKDRIFDNIENGNNETELLENLDLTMNKVYRVVANAHSGSITTTSGWTGSGASAYKDVTYGEAYGILPTISKTGYSLDGWYTTDSGGTETTASTIVSTGSQHQIYARWTANTYKVTLVTSEGTLTSTSGWTISGSSATKNVTYDATYDTLPTPTRTGYRFDGWFTTASGGTQVTSSTKVSITEPQTLYAHWTALTLVVTVNANGGTISSTSGWTGTGASATKTLTHGWAYGTLPTPTRAGYSFDGWYTAASGGTKVESTTTIPSNLDHSLYAHWTGNVYSVTFYYNNNATAGSTTLASTTASCQVANTDGTCNVTIPAAVRSSVGTWNNAYAGLSTSVGNMTQAVASSATAISKTSNGTYYAFYRSNVTVYRPSTTTACTTGTMYRNQWFSSNTALATTVLSDSTTGTSNVNPGLVSGYTFNRLTTASANAGTGYTVANAALTATGTFWTTETKSVAITNTYYYNNNTTAGGTTLASTTASANATQTLHCTSTAAATATNAAANVAVPAAVRSSVGTYNNAYAGLSTSVGNMTQAVASSATAISRTGNGTYYAFYRSNVTVYRPSSTTACTIGTMYRNQWFTSNTALATTVLSDSTTGTSNVNPGLVSGYTFNRLTTASANGGTGYTVANAALTATGTFWTTETKSVAITNTYYYNNNATAGGTTLASTTASANATQTLNCTSTGAAAATNAAVNISVPAAVRSSVGTWNNDYAGLSTSVGNMTQAVASSATAISRTGNGTYYAFYRSNVTVYRPSSTTACTIGTMYRNQWFTSNTALATTVLSDSTTGTSNVNPGLVSGYTFNRLTTASANGGTGYTVANAALTATGTFWTTETKTITATFKYSNNATGTVASTTANGTQTLHCNATTTATLVNGEISRTVPGTAPYGTTAVGWSTGANNMSTTSPTTGVTAYYAVYRSNVAIYRPTSTTVCTAQQFYRNGVMAATGATVYTMHLSTSNTGVTDVNPTMISGYSLLGLFENPITGGTQHTIATAAKTTLASFFVSETQNITGTFKYSSSTTGAVSSKTATATQGILCISTTAAQTNSSNFSISVTHAAPYGTTFVGWSTSANSMTTTTPNAANTTFYAVYRGTATNYYYNNGYTSRTIYRNAFMNAAGATAYSAVLSTTNTGTSNYATATGPNSAAWAGLAASQTATVAYSSVASAATTTATNLYTIYQYNRTFAKGNNVSSIGATSGYCRFTTGATTCNITLPTITTSSSYVPIGWASSTGTTAGIIAGCILPITSTGVTMYANAISSASCIQGAGTGPIVNQQCMDECSTECAAICTVAPGTDACYNCNSNPPNCAMCIIGGTVTMVNVCAIEPAILCTQAGGTVS